MLTVRPLSRPRAPSGEVLDGLLGLFTVLALASSWATHIVVCVMEGLWSFLAVGLVLFPVAVLHGVSVWVTAWI